MPIKPRTTKQSKSSTSKPATRSLKTKASQRGSKSTTTRETSQGYLHGYTSTEQSRLYHQARFLEDHVFAQVDYKAKKHILEVGSGVGAQTEILLERFPQLKITCVDASPEQITRAKKHLAPFIKSQQVQLTLANAQKLPFEDDTFDGAFITWFLEHVANPVGILKEARRVLQRNAVIHVNEVLNHSFFVHPYSPAIQQYWFAFNDHQWSLKGDPYVGAKLGNLLLEAGFSEVSTTFSYWHLDNRQPKLRARFIEYWIDLLLSGAPELEKAGKITKQVIKQMTAELTSLRDHHDSVFFMGFMKAQAKVL